MMPDGPMSAAPMAAIPALDAELDINNGTTADLFGSPQSPLPQHEVTSGRLNSQDIGVLLAANCATPPPFETVNPSALNSPVPLNDVSGEANNHMHSPFRSDFELFNDHTTPSWIPAALPHSQQHHAYTEPHPSPASTPGTFTEPFDFGDVQAPEHDGLSFAPQPPHLRQPHLYRAHSQPPEEVGPPHPHRQPHPPVQVTFQRSSGHYLGSPKGPRHPFPHALRGGGAPMPPATHAAPHRGQSSPLSQQHHPQQHQPDWRYRQHPYGRGAGPGPQRERPRRNGPGPTSAPSPLMGGGQQMLGSPMRMAGMPMTPPMHSAPLPSEQDRGTGGGVVGFDRLGEKGGSSELERWRFRERSDQTTLVLVMQSYIERIEKECERMKEFVRRGFGDDADGVNRELERKRMEKRNRNADATELTEQLEPLPRSIQPDSGIEDVPWDVPPNGQEIRNLDHDAATALLEAYDIPFLLSMFLAQKKELYLRFIGASRALMHRVLD